MLCQRKITKKREFAGHAKRWKYGMKGRSPGELIQIDHMSLNVPGIGYVKHFSAICPVTKFAVERIYQEANSKNAKNFLDQCIHNFPFQILSIQVDGGSEFMKDFEDACKTLGIPLWVLPPRSPKFNGNVERGNGTFKYEFYSQFDSSGKSIHLLQKSLQKFTDFYNKIRPHQGLKYLTPVEFLSKLTRVR